MKAIMYHRESGAATGWIEVPDATDLSLFETEEVGVYAGLFNPATHYVVDGSPPTLVTRIEALTPVVSPANPVEGDVVTVSGLPDPCWVRYNGELLEVIGGSVSGTARAAGPMGLELVGRYVGSYSVDVIAEVDTDSRWIAVRDATPAQIDAWLTANVTNMAEARDVLKLLILAVRKIGAR